MGAAVAVADWLPINQRQHGMCVNGLCLHAEGIDD